MNNMRRGNRFSMLAKGRTGKRGAMNRTEAKYAAEILDPGIADGSILVWIFEPMGFRVTQPEDGRGVIYTPDFLILRADQSIDFDDVKGTGIDDGASLVRAKCAAERFTMFRFRIAKLQTKKNGGGWEFRNL